MVALMRFTMDICRLLGLGNECPGGVPQQREEREHGGPSSAGNGALAQEVLIGEERARHRAERRRARRKRRRDRKKLEKEQKSERSGQDGEDEEEEDEGAESDQEDSGSEEEEEEEKVEEEQRSPRSKDRLTPPLASSGNRGNHQAPPVTWEEEPEWDVSSAFVANAASHIRPKSRTRASPRSGPRSRENRENEARTREVNGAESVSRRSTSLTEKGIELVQQGRYTEAVCMFTEAIKHNPNDYRFFGNRSYCYECLEQYPRALADAERSIQLAPEWPKGFFRKGSALMGMKRYSEAEKAMAVVLKLDQNCEEAVNELFSCRVLQLMELGFEEAQCVVLLERHSTVQAVLSSLEVTQVMNPDSVQDQAGPPCCSLWVGNVTAQLTEKHLWDLFTAFGEVDSIRILHERFCAFVNFRNANVAARALEKLHGVELENTRLVIRYPDRRTQRVPAPSALPQVTVARSGRRVPVQGDECYFWRTSGCHFGEKCRYKHIPEQRGRDRKPWQP